MSKVAAALLLAVLAAAGTTTTGYNAPSPAAWYRRGDSYGTSNLIGLQDHPKGGWQQYRRYQNLYPNTGGNEYGVTNIGSVRSPNSEGKGPRTLITASAIAHKISKKQKNEYRKKRNQKLQNQVTLVQKPQEVVQVFGSQVVPGAIYGGTKITSISTKPLTNNAYGVSGAYTTYNQKPGVPYVTLGTSNQPGYNVAGSVTTTTTTLGQKKPGVQYIVGTSNQPGYTVTTHTNKPKPGVEIVTLGTASQPGYTVTKPGYTVTNTYTTYPNTMTFNGDTKTIVKTTRLPKKMFRRYSSPNVSKLKNQMKATVVKKIAKQKLKQMVG